MDVLFGKTPIMDDSGRSRQLFFSIGRIGEIDGTWRGRLVAPAHARISAHSASALGHGGRLRGRSGPGGERRILLFQVLFSAGRAGGCCCAFGVASSNQLLELVTAGFTKVFVDRHATPIIHPTSGDAVTAGSQLTGYGRANDATKSGATNRGDCSGRTGHTTERTRRGRVRWRSGSEALWRNSVTVHCPDSRGRVSYRRRGCARHGHVRNLPSNH